MSKKGLFLISFFAVLLVFSLFMFTHSAQAQTCSSLGGWYNVGSPYACCSGQATCTCQNQQYLSYSYGCLSWGQTCTQYSNVCTQEGQCCSSYAQQCVLYSNPVCVNWVQQCTATQQQCDHYTTTCTGYGVSCTQYERYCSLSTQVCGCDGTYFFGVCIGNVVCSNVCLSYGTTCTHYDTVCNNYTTTCDHYTSVCTQYTPVCTQYYTGCLKYQNYCTGYTSCCLNYEQVCTNYGPYCTGYGCVSSAGGSNTAYGSCSYVNGSCGYSSNSAPSKPAQVGSGVAWNNCAIAGQSIPTFTWTYSDPDGDAEASYEIEVDDNSGFSAPMFNHLVNSVSTSYTLNLAQDDNSDWISQLAWNSTYFWRVRVKDGQGNWSVWSNSYQFKTPPHAYPSSSFDWTPLNPAEGELVTFNPDNTQTYGGTTISSYLWSVSQGNGTFATTTTQSSRYPMISFSTADNQVSLTVTDSDGYSCEDSQTVTTELPLPKYKEATPVSMIKKILAAVSSYLNLPPRD